MMVTVKNERVPTKHARMGDLYLRVLEYNIRIQHESQFHISLSVFYMTPGTHEPKLLPLNSITLRTLRLEKDSGSVPPKGTSQNVHTILIKMQKENRDGAAPIFLGYLSHRLLLSHNISYFTYTTYLACCSSHETRLACLVLKMILEVSHLKGNRKARWTTGSS